MLARIFTFTCAIRALVVALGASNLNASYSDGHSRECPAVRLAGEEYILSFQVWSARFTALGKSRHYRVSVYGELKNVG